ncbi:MAG TPA: sigma-54 dependent transcriptional regulator [Candidatus Acidoferrales bacterium]|nr:sigma-54 dependent transcriptional regulator [Candidatus Acidoferrales bacterium]
MGTGVETIEKSAMSGPTAVDRLETATVLIVDDEDSALRLCADIATEAGLRVRTATTTERALETLDEYPVDIVITDLRVPELGGLELLRRVREHYPEIAVLMLTQYGTIQTAVEATRLGASDYVTKPFHIDELRRKLQRLIHEQEIDQENRVLREQLRTRPGYKELIGTSPKMQRVYKLIEKVSQHSYPVLILGESGTGKELVARSIHFSGARRHEPFVPLDCNALTPTLIESELFGYVKGAFTGAMHNKQGVFESADKGTLFLDEIGNLPVDMQAKLLRVVQEREIKPVGSNERVPVNVRIIAATNRDLEAAVRENGFRKDLFFRLNVVQIKLPPLRERKSDIPLLVQAFLEKFADTDRPMPVLAEDAMSRLTSYDWPGNIRELENAIERAVALGSGPILHSGDLPSNLQYGSSAEGIPASDEIMPLEEMERRAILRALRETNGDKLVAARLLRIGKTTLYRKLKQYQVTESQQ